MSNLTKQWQVQTRRSKAHPWKAKGLYETRDAAREKRTALRTAVSGWNGTGWDRYGFRNTRVIAYQKGVK